MHILDLIFPKRCLGCNRIGKYVCTECSKTFVLRDHRCSECDRLAIDGITHPGCKRNQGIDGLVTVFINQRVIKKAIKSLKYRFVFDTAEELIRQIPVPIWDNLKLNTKGFMLYPIPLHTDRFKWRGFNQAEKLGSFVAQQLGIKMVNALLTRQAKRTPQADIVHRLDRIKNAQGLFTCANKKIPNTILLFDDVWTTGATMKEAAKVLKRNGAEKVWCMTLAR